MQALRLQALPRHLYPPRLGRADYAAAGMPELRKTDDDVGEVGRMSLLHLTLCRDTRKPLTGIARYCQVHVRVTLPAKRMPLLRLPALSCNLDSSGTSRKTHPPNVLPALRQAHDNVEETNSGMVIPARGVWSSLVDVHGAFGYLI